MDYRKLVDKLDKIASRQILNELKYGQEDPENPGFMWAPNDPSGAGDGSGELVRAGGGYLNSHKVPVNKPTPAPVAEPEAAVATPVSAPGNAEVRDLGKLPEPTPTPSPEPDGPTCTPEIREKIKYAKSFNQAFALAKQSGCDPFEWCGVYVTQGGQDTKPMDPVAATGNTSAYGQGVNMAINRAKLKGIISKTGPYSQADVDKVIAGLQDGTIGHQMDTKAGVASSAAATMGQQVKDALLKGNRLASVDQTANTNRFYPGVTK